MKMSLQVLRSILPEGTLLSEESWRGRHRAILVVLWLHLPFLLVVGIVTDHGLGHSSVEAGAIGILAAAASFGGGSRAFRASCATLGLVASSAILVHFSGGMIEMHFHFFVMVAVVTLYQMWTPFLLAIGFVVLHHGTMGILDPSDVYNHPSAISNPWKWALVHGLFIAAESAAGLTAWKMNELSLTREKSARTSLEVAHADLAEAQSMASIGSWEWDLLEDRVWWSEELYRIFDQPDEFVPSYDGFLPLLHHDERARVHALVESALNAGVDYEFDSRVLLPGGAERVIHALGRAFTGVDGTVVRLAGTVQDITERKVLEDQIEHQAFHDSLTGLANRALFFDRVEHALARQARGTTSLAVLFIDLDDFKTVNDSMGHGVGDALLVELGKKIAAVLRPSDTFARLGGDEFAILLEDLAQEDAAVVITERIITSVMEPLLVDDDEFFLSVSVGIAFSSESDGHPTEELVRRADTAMYAAKKRGKGSYAIFQEGMAEAAVERLRVKADLQRAIEGQELVLHYQPIVDMRSGEISGVEALVRWVHPERGMISPLQFIPLAEETGLILPLTKWVLSEACSAAIDWTGPSGAPISLAVNVSAVRFHDPDFEFELEEVLQATGMDPRRLTLEITESVLVQDGDEVADRLRALKALGLKIAIDDFGTGYSSLSYLRDFPIDLLKVDKAFIDSIALGPEESALAQAVIKLGATLGMAVVAEGVERPEQAEVLENLNCDFAQGYLFSKPVEASQLEALLKDGVPSRTALASAV